MVTAMILGHCKDIAQAAGRAYLTLSKQFMLET
jgi:hypothetical protein